MINSSQIRAARALINWSQKDLANRAQVTQVTVANIETNRNNGSRSTLKNIQSALESQGVEFIGNGVRHKEEYLGHFVGEDAYVRLLDDIYYCLKDSKEDVLFSGADERKNYPGVAEAVRKIKTSGIRTRLIIEEGNNYILGDLEDYRQVPSQYFSNGVTAVYGNKYALLIVTPEGPRVHVVTNVFVADAQRKTFEFLWDRGMKPDHSIADAQY